MRRHAAHSMIAAASFTMLAAIACQDDDPKRRPVGEAKPAPGVRDESEGRKPMKARLMAHYDKTNPQIDLDLLVAPGVPKDGIPSLTDPDRVGVRKATYPLGDGRVVEVVIDGKAVAYPLGILNFHEIANDKVGDVPVAVTYCPLCDSVSVLDRRLAVPDESGGSKTVTLEFGVSGLLYNSNVVMYERESMALWSQVYMSAVTGPHVGLELKHLPVRMMRFDQFKAKHPDGEVLTTDTGYDRSYDADPYRRYFDDPTRVFMEFEYGDELPPKTLGLGVSVGDFAAFITADAAGTEPVTIETPIGPVVVSSTEAGMHVESAPKGAKLLQTFYHSWSAFYPQTEVVE